MTVIVFRIQTLRACGIIDGYNENGMQLDIIDKRTLKSIKSKDELHDICEGFLEHPDI